MTSSDVDALADRLDRDRRAVREDLGVLGDYDVVHFEQSDGIERPYVPYERIEVHLEISGTHPNETGPKR